MTGLRSSAQAPETAISTLVAIGIASRVFLLISVKRGKRPWVPATNRDQGPIDFREIPGGSPGSRPVMPARHPMSNPIAAASPAVEIAHGGDR